MDGTMYAPPWLSRKYGISVIFQCCFSCNLELLPPFILKTKRKRSLCDKSSERASSIFDALGSLSEPILVRWQDTFGTSTIFALQNASVCLTCRFVHSPRYKEIRPILSEGKEVGEMRTVTVDFSFSGKAWSHTLCCWCRFVHNPRFHAVKPFVSDPQGLGQLRSVTSTFTWKGINP